MDIAPRLQAKPTDTFSGSFSEPFILAVWTSNLAYWASRAVLSDPRNKGCRGLAERSTVNVCQHDGTQAVAWLRFPSTRRLIARSQKVAPGVGTHLGPEWNQPRELTSWRIAHQQQKDEPQVMRSPVTAPDGSWNWGSTMNLGYQAVVLEPRRDSALAPCWYPSRSGWWSITSSHCHGERCPSADRYCLLIFAAVQTVAVSRLDRLVDSLGVSHNSVSERHVGSLGRSSYRHSYRSLSSDGNAPIATYRSQKGRNLCRQ